MSLGRRYNLFREKGIDLINIPFIRLNPRNSDKFEYYIAGRTTYDKLAYKWYNREDYSYIISIANPEYIDENDIEDGSQIRIPFPIDEVENEINKKIEDYKRL